MASATETRGNKPPGFSGIRGEFDGEVFAGLGDPFHTSKSFKVGERGVEIVRGNGNRGRQSTAGAGAALCAQIFQIAVMSGNDLMERGEGTIESRGASKEIGTAGYPRVGSDSFLEVRPSYSVGGPHATDIPRDCGKTRGFVLFNTIEYSHDREANGDDENKNEHEESADDKKDALWQRTTRSGFGHGSLMALG
jgi:hypothetical protein